MYVQFGACRTGPIKIREIFIRNVIGFRSSVLLYINIMHIYYIIDQNPTRKPTISHGNICTT